MKKMKCAIQTNRIILKYFVSSLTDHEVSQQTFYTSIFRPQVWQVKWRTDAISYYKLRKRIDSSFVFHFNINTFLSSWDKPLKFLRRLEKSDEFILDGIMRRNNDYTVSLCCPEFTLRRYNILLRDDVRDVKNITRQHSHYVVIIIWPNLYTTDRIMRRYNHYSVSLCRQV